MVKFFLLIWSFPYFLTNELNPEKKFVTNILITIQLGSIHISECLSICSSENLLYAIRLCLLRLIVHLFLVFCQFVYLFIWLPACLFLGLSMFPFLFDMSICICLSDHQIRVFLHIFHFTPYSLVKEISPYTCVL